MFQVECTKCKMHCTGKYKVVAIWVLNHINCDNKELNCTAQVTVNFRAHRCTLYAKHLDNHETKYGDNIIRWFKEIE